MTESARKKNKARRAPALVIIQSDEIESSLRFMSTHPKKPGIFDATTFAKGRAMPKPAHAWDKGEYSGRPKLTASLMPHIRRRYGSAPIATLTHLNASMRAWWRLFDKYEDIRSVEDIDDVDELVHGALAIKEGFTHLLNPFLIILNDTRKARNQHPLDIRLPKATPQHSSIPDQEHINAIAKELTRRIRDMFMSWRKADSAVSELNDWKLDHGQWSPRRKFTQFDERHAHCAYRQACAEHKDPVLRRDKYVAWLGLQSSENYSNPFVIGFSPAVTGLYPSRRQTAYMLYLFLCKTGWNLETALDIDVEDYWRPHPTNPSFAIIYATKERAKGEYQRAASEIKPRMSAYNLLSALIARTKPLREMLRAELCELEKQEEDKQSEEQVKRRMNELRRCIRSPWLHVVIKEEKPISALTNKFVYEAEQRLSTLIAEMNAQGNQKSKINENLKIGDFRDAYISVQYRRSNYSWIVAHLAAGHKDMRSLVTYLRKRQWKAQGEQAVREFTEALWGEIRITNAVDPAILHVLVRQQKITEQQRLRWTAHKDRTRVGVGCKDFKNPPKLLAPEHQTGEGCRVQRCSLCSNAVIFNDSLDPLARRLAQLLSIKERIPLATWHDSSWPLESDTTERILFENWDKSLVQNRILYWKSEIGRTAHLQLDMEGEYAA